jgi:predicted permease
MFTDLWIRLRSLFQRDAVEDELDAELRFHFDQHVKKLVDSGLAPAEARRRARLEFGALDQVKEECRDARGVNFIENLVQGIRYSLRMLRKSPGFTVVAVLTLALGIGATTAVFSVVEGVLLKPLPYPHPGELIFASHTAPGIGIKGLTDLTSSPSTNFIYREQNQTLQDIGLYDSDSVSVTGLAQPEQVSAVDVTDGTLPILGVPPMLGRFFTRADDSPGSPLTAILDYGYWTSKFGADPSVIGRNITVDGQPREVIGVMPQSFRFLMEQQEPEIFLPLQLNREKTLLGHFAYESIARLKPGVSIAAATSDLTRLLPIVLQSFPPPPGYSLSMFTDAKFTPELMPLKQAVVGGVGGVLWVLMGGIGLVLLIACANVANLLLVRAEGRQHELAVRAALGASRARIAADLFVESLVLGLIGSVLGAALAYVALPALVALAPAGLPRANEIAIDAPVLLFTLAVALLVSLLSASLPVFKYAGVRLGTGLRESGRGSSESRERHRARSALVVTQVALAFVLLICSGLMIRTFRALTNVQPGFTDPAEIQTFGISIPSSDVPVDEQVGRMQADIARRIQAIPGVSSVGFGNGVPMGQNHWHDLVLIEGVTYPKGKLPPLRLYKFISPGYLATLGTPVLAGRDITWDDISSHVPVAIVSENLAREISGDPAAALGKRIRGSAIDDWRVIIGVVADVYQDGVNKDAPAAVYWPIEASHLDSNNSVVLRAASFVIRTPRAGSVSLMDDVRRAVSAEDANLPLSDVHTLDYYYRKSLARTSFTLIMLAIAGGMAFFLGVLGLYGVIAYSVSQRTREIGIRMALGAQQQDLTRMFVRHGLLLAVAGVAFGLATSAVAMRLMKSLLFHVSPADPLTYVAVSVGLIATAVLASYLPSRRAAKVDPLDALRAE